jgi:hypothetical protein
MSLALADCDVVLGGEAVGHCGWVSLSGQAGSGRGYARCLLRIAGYTFCPWSERERFSVAKRLLVGAEWFRLLSVCGKLLEQVTLPYVYRWCNIMLNSGYCRIGLH